MAEQNPVSDDTAAVAARCLTDSVFAQELLEGEAYPEVREALLADLNDNSDVQGFLNPCPLPPDKLPSLRSHQLYIQPATWNQLSFARLNTLSLQNQRFNQTFH